MNFVLNIYVNFYILILSHSQIPFFRRLKMKKTNGIDNENYIRYTSFINKELVINVKHVKEYSTRSLLSFYITRCIYKDISGMKMIVIIIIILSIYKAKNYIWFLRNVQYKFLKIASELNMVEQ